MSNLTRAQIVQAAREAAQRHGVREGLFVRQMKQEANFDPTAQSVAGAGGVAQITPDTARAWHVNAADPIAALDAAAKHMKGYIDKYGEEGALRAYNAGEGAIKASKGYAETNHYVDTILGGARASTPAKSSGGAAVAKTMTVPASTKQDTTGAIMDVLASHRSGSKLSQLGHALATGAYDSTTPARTTTTVAKAAAAPAKSAGKSPLLEMFWQGAGGINVKDGAKVPQGFVDGHTDHVHVAAGRKTVVELGKLAQSMGLHVGENSHFNGGKRVTSGHATDSYHYKDEAIDVSGDPAKMAHFAHTVAHNFGIKVNG